MLDARLRPDTDALSGRPCCNCRPDIDDDIAEARSLVGPEVAVINLLLKLPIEEGDELDSVTLPAAWASSAWPSLPRPVLAGPPIPAGWSSDSYRRRKARR